MECFDIPIPYNVDIFFVGDLHLGEGLFARKQFERFWEMYVAHNRRARVFCMGDWMSSIPPRDRRHDVRALDDGLPTIEATRQWVTAFLKKWKRKILGYHTGNHEETLAMQYGDAVESICKEAGVRYLGFLAYVNLVPPSGEKIRLITTHGDGSINSRLDDIRERKHAMERKLRRILEPLGEADFYAMGHTHKLLVIKPEDELYLEKGNGDVDHKYRSTGKWFANTGCFLRTYVKGEISYGERRLYPPLELGCVKLVIRKGKIKTVERVVL